MNTKKLTSLSPEVVAKMRKIPTGKRSAFVDSALRVALDLPPIEYLDYRRKVTPEEAPGLVAQYGSATKAAAAIGVAVSTITRALKKK